MIRTCALVILAACLAPGVSAQQDGAEAFAEHCSICHNKGGTGTPGLAPPLDRPQFWQALDADAATYIGGIAIKGFNAPITVRGERYVGMFMPPVVAASDTELAAIASWILSELGDMDHKVSETDIADIRERGLTNADLRAMRPKSE